MKTIVVIIAVALALAGCTRLSTRISSALQRQGLDRQRADCVGTRLERDLSLRQLRRLGRAATAYGRDDPDPGVLTVGDLLRVAAALRDPAIPVAVGKAAAGCGALP